MKKTESGTTTYYVISSVVGAALEVTSAGVQRAYVMSGNSVVAQLNPNGQFYWLHLDHLGSGRKMTDTSGTMVYRAEFDPYGKLLYEWSSPSNLNTKKFTGYERDAATNLDYAQARMYASDWGRFLSPDPMGLGAANSASPKTLNRYSYVHGDPVNFIDPSGLLTLILGGFNNAEDPDWARPGADFWNAVRDTFGEDPRLFPWSGHGVTAFTLYNGIVEAAVELVKFLKEYPFKEGEKLNIVGFSHGGNVAKMASWAIDRPIDNLVTLATSVNWDLGILAYRNPLKVKNHCNVSSLSDMVQVFASSVLQIAAWGYFTYKAAFHASWAAWYLWRGDFHNAAVNAGQAAAYSAAVAAITMSTKIDPFANHNVLFGSEGHSDMHSATVWNKAKQPCGLNSSS